jgi:hypothetical protein
MDEENALSLVVTEFIFAAVGVEESSLDSLEMSTLFAAAESSET